MSRPLLITDCDEVLLHMVTHFGAWLDAEHQLDFQPRGGHFTSSTRRRSDGTLFPDEQLWPLLNGFFETQMHRQTLVPHAAEALAEIGEVADIVVLTNILPDWHSGRVAQLAAHDIRHRVVCNQGGKGTPARTLIEEFAPSAAVFVDDLAVHHASLAEHTPEVWRLHMVSEPTLAPDVAPAPEADARIDDWREAKDWILARFEEGPRG
ncbi:HAD family hydrolase [Sphingomonas arantia]|uniref:HAD family hydrolase n=1 Tax=Sphingomonas arantia TaxID=1460676 RepID=A0ABW4TVF8_9SPHN